LTAAILVQGDETTGKDFNRSGRSSDGALGLTKLAVKEIYGGISLVIS
jgi:hypothetical protein